jgi:hypothetical protein
MSKPDKLTLKKTESFIGKTSKGSEFVLMVEPVVGASPCEQLLAVITALQTVYAEQCEIL